MKVILIPKKNSPGKGFTYIQILEENLINVHVIYFPKHFEVYGSIITMTLDLLMTAVNV